MPNSLTQSQAALFQLLASRNGCSAIEVMNAGLRHRVETEAALIGVSPSDLISTIAGAGDDKDRRIALLEAHILDAGGRLGSWLTDNTENVFEEEPEIDAIRYQLQELVS